MTGEGGPPPQRARAGRVGLAGVLIAGIVGVAFGTGYTSTRSLTGDDSVWLRKGDTIAQINAPANRLQAAVDDKGGRRPLAPPGDPLQIVQQPDGTVYVAVPGSHQVYKVDLSTMEPGPATSGSAVLAGAGAAFALDGARGSVIPLDPATGLPSAPPVDLGVAIQSQAIAGSTAYVAGTNGTVWAVGQGGRKVTAFHVGARGDPVAIAVAGSKPTALNAATGTLVVLDRSTRTSNIALPGGRGPAIEVAPNQPGPDVWLVRGGALVDVNLARATTSSVALRAGDRFEAPVVFGEQVYVPDRSTSSVLVYDAATRRLVRSFPVPPGAPGDPGGIEVVAKAGAVWVDEPSSRNALAVDHGGTVARTVDKGTGADVFDPASAPAALAAPVPPAVPVAPTTPAPTTPAPTTPAPTTPAPTSLPSSPPVAPPSPALPPAAGPAPGQGPRGALPPVTAALPTPVAPPVNAPPTAPPLTAPPVTPGPRPPATGAPVKVAVPAVTALSTDQACAAVVAAGLTCVSADRGRAPAGTQTGVVVSQSPAAGGLVDARTTVTVSYFATAALVTVPDVTGQSPDAACAALSQVNLTCTRNGTPNAPVGTRANQVTSTSPPAKATVAPGTSVTVTYYSSLAPVAAPACTSQPVAALSCAQAGITIVQQVQETALPIDCTVTWGQSVAAGQPMSQGDTLVVWHDADCLQPLNQFRQTTPFPNVHFLTRGGAPNAFYTAAGQVGSVYRDATKPGLSALMEFTYRGEHHYFTTNAGFNDPGWSKTGVVVGYVYASDPGNGAVPVYARNDNPRGVPGEYQWSLSPIGAVVFYEGR